MRFLFLIVLSLFLTVESLAQLCTPQTVTFPITPTSTLQYTPSYSSGVILFPFTATAGCTYTFSTCGQSSIDTYLRLHNSAYTLLGQWDDQCGFQSTFTWTCPAAGQYYVHLSRYTCFALTGPTTMSYVVSCPTPPCSNPIVNAGPDAVVCPGQPTTLNGTVTAGTGTGSGGSSSSITITISGIGFLDETSWNLSNASGTSVGSGGPYVFASNNTVTLTNVGTGPYSFSMETQGTFNDNNATYTISCNGTTVNTGSITGGQTTTASVTGCGGTSGGGTLPITYVWSPGATLSSTSILNPIATPTVTTTYTLTATSGTCTSTDQMTVFVSPAPTISAGPDVTICSGQTTTLNGSASAVGGFGGPIDVNIFSGSNLDETTWNITNSLGAIIASGGPYAAASNQTITINAPSNPPYTFNLETQGPSNSNVAGYNVLCGGTSISGGLAILTGGQTIAVPVSGCPGAIPTTLSWSPGATLSSTTVANPTASPSTTTTYTLTATANGCTSTDAVVVNVVPGPTVTVNNATICGGQSATLTATPSAAGGTYLWSPGGATTQTITVSPTSTTTYTVTYSNGSCSSAPASGVVTVSASPTLSVNSSTICPGSSAILTATASPIGGTYLWSPNGETTQTISVSPASTTTYSVAYSLNGCSSSTATGTVTVSNVVDWANIQSPGSSSICQGQTLTIYGQVFEAGVTPPAGQGAGITVQFAYNTSNTNPASWPSTSWTTASFNPAGTSVNNDEYAGIIPALSPGTYYYAFSYTMNGCTNYGGYSASGGGFWDGTTNVNGTLIVNPNLSPTFNPIAAICAGSAINALPTTSLNSIAGSWSPALNNQTTTTYTFTPAVGVCATTTTLTLTVNPLPSAAITAPATTVLTCATPSITLTATGGGTYSWSNGTAVVGTTATLNVTTPGTYTVTVTSASGCVATASQIITQNISLPSVAITQPLTSILTCTTTTINLTATGGGTYSWSNGTTNVGSTASINVTAPGVYTVTVTGANGCTGTANSNITQDIVAPTTSIVSFANTTVLDCNINVITLAASGAGGWVSSSWSNGTTVITTNNNISVTTPGTYTVSVTGTNGCIGTATQVITQNITQPNALITNPLTTILTCSTPTISLTGTGGGTYSWMDGNGVIGTNATINITTANTYTLIVTGANGCDATSSITITDNFLAPIVSVTASNTVLSCTNTSITLVASGGGSYSWTGGSTSSSLTVTSPGTYTVTVTSPNGCTASSSQVITQNSNPPLAAITPPATSVLTCAVTSITLTATGGTSYSWSNGTAIIGTSASITVNTIGTYTVTVTGANGCTATAVQNITQNISAPNVTITPPVTTILNCTTTNINLIASGGTYSWSNGTAVVGTSAILAVSAPGTYTVTVTGANGCTGTASQTITQNSVAPPAAINSLATTVLTCTTPSITVTATGGGTYSWSNGTAIVGTNASLNVTAPGTYTVTVLAANGCTATASQVITQNNTAPALSITAPISTVLTCTTTSISLTANGVGTISWTNPSIISVNPTISVTTPGVYTVTLTAANGCTASLSQTITQNTATPAAAITTPSTTVITCTTTSISLTATGGGTYSWSNGAAVVGTSATLVVTTPGTYTVTVMGTNGCTATAATTITQNTIPPSAGINVPNTTILSCTTTSIPLTATGGGSYTWYSGTATIGNTSTLTVTNPGFYTVVVTAPNGCDALTNVVITQDIVAPVASITNNANSSVLDCNTPQISLTGVGGTNASWSNGTSVVSTVANLNVTSAGTYTYTGTNANGCFDTESITITFTPNTTPTFSQIAAICTNGSFTLPTTSTNNVAGTWSPAPNYTTTTTYTFQPNAGVCANTASMTITVNPYPVVSVQNDTICVGQSTTINSSVNLAGGSYAWLPTNSVTSNITVTPLSTSYFQVIYALNGCSDTSITEIYVKPVSFPVANNQTICTGQTAELIATAALSGGTFIWSNSVQNDTIQVNPTTTTNYSVTYNLNGCVSPPVNAIVTVNPVPTVGVNNSTICAGNSTTITAIPNLLGGTFYWGSPGVVGAPSQTLIPLNDTTLSVYYVLNGCSSAVATSSIIVNPLPIATFSASVTQGCSPLSVTLTAADASNNSYNWSTSNALTSTGSQTSLLFQMNGGFDVSLTTTLNGCTVTETLYNYIQVDNYPIASFEPSSDQFTEPNQTLSFMNNSLGASTYAWDFGDGGTSSEEGPIHTFGGNELGSTIILTAISTLGCADTAQFFIGYDPGLVYYIPNSFTPDGDMNNQVFTPILTSGIDIYNYTMYIFNRWGEIIFESNDPSIGWDGSYGIEGKDAEVGLYTYQIFIKIPTFDERKMILGHVNLIR